MVEPGWLEALASLPSSKLALVPGGHTEEGWPPSLVAFVQTAASLSAMQTVERRDGPTDCACTPALTRALAEGVSLKKQHEARPERPSCLLCGLTLTRSTRWPK